MALRVVTKPKGELIPLDDAKQQLRVDFDDDNDLITGIIRAAGRRIEAITARRYLAQTLEWGRDCLANPMVLPVAPGGDSASIAVDWVKYFDLQGVQQTLDPALYWARPIGPTLKIVPRWFVVWPWVGDGPERVTIRFHTIGDPSCVSDNVRHACRLLVSHWYRNRDAVVGVDNRDSSGPLPEGVEQLLFDEQWEVPG